MVMMYLIYSSQIKTRIEIQVINLKSMTASGSWKKCNKPKVRPRWFAVRHVNWNWFWFCWSKDPKETSTYITHSKEYDMENWTLLNVIDFHERCAGVTIERNINSDLCYILSLMFITYCWSEMHVSIIWGDGKERVLNQVL